MKDLFGREVPEPRTAKRDETPCGYAARPGTGPAGEFCRTCLHATYHQMSKRYWKCNLMSHIWTGGPKTDIRLKSPACSKWEQAKRKLNTKSGANRRMQHTGLFTIRATP